MPGQCGEVAGGGRHTGRSESGEIMMQAATPTPIKSTLIDITKCIGCRACQVACKQWNDRDGEQTELEWNLGLQNPATLSAKTLTLITYHELPDEKAPGGLNYLFT